MIYREVLQEKSMLEVSPDLKESAKNGGERDRPKNIKHPGLGKTRRKTRKNIRREEGQIREGGKLKVIATRQG